MGWKESLISASFRGAAFKIESAEGEGGRRVAKHVFAQRDGIKTEDMGKKEKEFSIEAYAIGIDYMVARDALISACEEAGPGELSHPYLGVMQVVCTGLKWRETTRDGGMVTFSLTFCEETANNLPSAVPDTFAALQAAVTAAIGAAIEAFLAAYSVASMPGRVADAAADIANQAISGINAARAQARKVADFARMVTSTLDALFTMVNDPEDLATSMQDIIAYVPEGIATRDSYREMMASKNFTVAQSVPPIVTPQSTQVGINQTALLALTQQITVCEAARMTLEIEFDSYDEAITIRDEITEKLDEFMADSDDNSYQAYQELYAALCADIERRSADLSRLETVVLQQTSPALFISQERYGSIDMADDIVARNAVRHPGFVPGGMELDMLSMEAAGV